MKIAYTIIIIFSCIAILLKDIIIASIYGANNITDAFFFVYQVTFVVLVILGGIGGPFYNTTVMFASDVTTRPKPEIKALLNSFLTISGLCFLALSIAIFFFSGTVSDILLPEASNKFKELFTTQLKIISPAFFIGGITGILSGIFNSYGRFTHNAAAPAIMSFTFIATLLLFGRSNAGLIPVSALLASVCALFLYQIFTLKSINFRYKPALKLDGTKLLIIKKIFFPVLITLIIGNLYLFVDMYFIGETEKSNLNIFENYQAGWSELYYATSIFLFVSSMILGILNYLTFKTNEKVGKQAFENNASYHFNTTLDLVFFIAFPTTAFVMVFAEDIIRLVFERGQFAPTITIAVTNLLLILSVAIIPFIIKNLYFNHCFKINSIKAPFTAATIGLLLKVALNYGLVKIAGFGVYGVAASTVIVIFIEVVILSLLLRDKIRTDYENFLYLTIQAFSVTLIAGIFILFTKLYIDNFLPYMREYQGAKLFVYAVVGAIIYFLFSFPVKVYAARILLDNIKAIGPVSLINKEVENFKELVNSLNKDYELLYKNLVDEKNKSDDILLNILPEKVAEELKDTGVVKPVHFELASVMFTDFKGYTEISKTMSNEQLVKELDTYYKFFDVICDNYNLEKIKTIGDSYMCVGGVPTPNQTHAIDCVIAAFCFLIFMYKTKLRKEYENKPYFSTRIGIHTGSVVAGIIGSKKTSYDVWGDTVNLASRMESGGEPGKINVSATTYELIKDYFICTYRGEQEVKNSEKTGMYFVNRIKPEFADPRNKIMPNEKFMEIYNELKNR